MHTFGIGNLLSACRRVLALGLSVLLSGCATLMTEKTQTVRVNTVPAGRAIYYQGAPVADGDSVVVRRDFRPPAFELEPGDNPRTFEMDYSVDPWVIGDAGLAIFFILPGVIAGGLDVATGAWRKLEPAQIIDIDAALAEAEEKDASGEEPRTVHQQDPADLKEASPSMKQRVEPAAERYTPSEPSSVSKTKSDAPVQTFPDPAPATPEPYQPEEGIVSWYDHSTGHKTASGEAFDPEGMTAAHRTLPFGTRVRVTRLDTNYSVVVTINDRGPFIEGRIIDLAPRPAEKLGLPAVGIAPCRVEVLSPPGG